MDIPQILAIVLGSSLLTGVFTSIVNRFRPTRTRERLGAWIDEIEALERIGEGTARRRALTLASRPVVDAGIANRLVPNVALQVAGFFAASLFTFAITSLFFIYLLAESQEGWFPYVLVILYFVFGVIFVLVGWGRGAYTPLLRTAVIKRIRVLDGVNVRALDDFEGTTSRLMNKDGTRFKWRIRTCVSEDVQQAVREFIGAGDPNAGSHQTERLF